MELQSEHFDECRGKLNVVDPNCKTDRECEEYRIRRYDNRGRTTKAKKIEDIQKYGVDIFTVGSDWIGTFDYLNAFCKVVYLERTPNIPLQCCVGVLIRL